MALRDHNQHTLAPPFQACLSYDPSRPRRHPPAIRSNQRAPCVTARRASTRLRRRRVDAILGLGYQASTNACNQLGVLPARRLCFLLAAIADRCHRLSGSGGYLRHSDHCPVGMGVGRRDSPDVAGRRLQLLCPSEMVVDRYFGLPCRRRQNRRPRRAACPAWAR